MKAKNLLANIASKKTDILMSATRGIHKAGFQVKKHSPEILVVAGTVGVVTSAVMACKATLKVNDILEETKNNLDAIHEVAENPELAEKYSAEDAKKDTTIVYVQTGVKLVKLYGPAVALGAFSLGCMLTSNNILRKRNIALAAAYTTIDKGFKEYRGRVIERFGEELDRELRYNIKAKEVEEVIVDEDGNEQVVTKTIQTADVKPESQYARFFDEYCNGWSKDPEMNLYFLRQQQNYANDMLQSRGHLFLNEVYDMLGIPRTTAGQVVGWRYDLKNPTGDNYVDFGIYDLHNENKRLFVNGHERSILLDFNVDGNIMNQI